MKGTAIDIAADWLNKGEVVAIPTETVYGLAANMYCLPAVERIFEVKNRPRTNPLIAHIADFSQVESLARDIPDLAFHLAEHFWPGPLTLVLPAAPTVPELVTAAQPTVAIRMPAHPVTNALLRKLSFPLVAPSANKYNYISPVSAAAVEEMIGTEIPYILDGGDCKVGIESTIICCSDTGITLLREGSITEEEIRAVAGEDVSITRGSAIRHPGKNLRHYSPRTPMRTASTAAELQSLLLKPQRIAILSYSDDFAQLPAQRHIRLPMDPAFREAATGLYAALYALDKENHDLIIAELYPETGIGRALNERLRKAAASG